MDRRNWAPPGWAAAWCLIVFTLAGCVREHPSPIVEMVQNAGAGDMRRVTASSMVQWFDKHPDVALKAAELCKPARAAAQARWPQTTEGRVCDAAAQVAGFIEWRRDLQMNNDHKTFQGGSQ